MFTKEGVLCMADPYLSKDETVILATENIMVGSVSLAAILTNKRILLIQSKEGQLQADEIPVLKIRLIGSDENEALEPVITVYFVTAKGERREAVLTFSQKPGEQRKKERDEWKNTLMEQILPSLAEEPSPVPPPPVQETIIPPLATSPSPAKTVPPVKPAVEPAPEPAAPPPAPAPRAQPVPKAREPEIREAVPDTDLGVESLDYDILGKHDRPAGLSFPDLPPLHPLHEAPLYEAPPQKTRKKMIVIAAIVIIIAAAVVGVFYYTQIMPQKAGGIAPIVPPPVITVLTTVPTTFPTPIPVTTALVNASEISIPANVSATIVPASITTASPTTSQPQVAVPATGVWARVLYTGKFSGSVGETGREQQVIDTGDHVYRIVTKNGTIRATIQKQDASADFLTVELFRDGMLLNRAKTSRPNGEVDLLVDLKSITPLTTAPTVTVTKPQ